MLLWWNCILNESCPSWKKSFRPGILPTCYLKGLVQPLNMGDRQFLSSNDLREIRQITCKIYVPKLPKFNRDTNSEMMKSQICITYTFLMIISPVLSENAIKWMIVPLSISIFSIFTLNVWKQNKLWLNHSQFVIIRDLQLKPWSSLVKQKRHVCMILF